VSSSPYTLFGSPKRKTQSFLFVRQVVNWTIWTNQIKKKNGKTGLMAQSKRSDIREKDDVTLEGRA
jgi:hypothetical protein